MSIWYIVFNSSIGSYCFTESMRMFWSLKGKIFFFFWVGRERPLLGATKWNIKFYTFCGFLFFFALNTDRQTDRLIWMVPFCKNHILVIHATTKYGYFRCKCNIDNLTKGGDHWFTYRLTCGQTRDSVSAGAGRFCFKVEFLQALTVNVYLTMYLRKNGDSVLTS